MNLASVSVKIASWPMKLETKDDTAVGNLGVSIFLADLLTFVTVSSGGSTSSASFPLPNHP